MRALLGLDPDEAGKGAAAAEHFERALGFYGIDFAPAAAARPGLALAQDARLARGPRRDRLRRDRPSPRRRPDSGRRDILSLLLDVRDEAGEGFTDREVRDQVMTLMFAGHDTSTSTLTFMMYELARHPDVIEQLQRGAGPGARRRRPRHRAARARDALPRHGPRRGPAPLPAGLDRPAPGGPRVRVRRLHGAPRAPTSTTAPGPATASPRSSPSPRRSSPSASPASARRRCRAAPTSPSAAAQRICIGKRFGQTEVKLVATMLLQRLRLDAAARPHDDGPPDADPLAQGRAADAGACPGADAWGDSARIRPASGRGRCTRFGPERGRASAWPNRWVASGPAA